MNLPPDNNKIYDDPLAVFWFEDGILHKISKNTPRNPEKVSRLYSRIKELANGKKVCAIIEVSDEGVTNKHTREYLKKEIPKMFSAVALLAKTPLGNLTGTLMSVLAPTHIPMKIFEEEEQAKDWLKNYVHLC